MRVLCLPLLLSLLCSRHALGLQCYSCHGIQDSGQCLPTECLEGSVCFKATLSAPEGYGRGHEVEFSGCAPSCEAVSQNFQRKTLGTHPEITMEGLGQQTPPRLELRDVSCCLQDLCNRPGLERPFMVGRAPGPPAGGLLLLLAPALLWALL
ncbi:lymphocyte antigen 6H-like [Callospermophilus lateralis]|uniref:lymphocyte antigen 6H-like n=1 Tax=Callospermophilus lateralis TaxID=76772 RepID=UPI004038A625